MSVYPYQNAKRPKALNPKRQAQAQGDNLYRCLAPVKVVWNCSAFRFASNDHLTLFFWAFDLLIIVPQRKMLRNELYSILRPISMSTINIHPQQTGPQAAKNDPVSHT